MPLESSRRLRTTARLCSESFCVTIHRIHLTVRSDIDSMSGLVDDTIRVVHDTKYWGGLFIVAAPAGEADSDIYW